MYRGRSRGTGRSGTVARSGAATTGLQYQVLRRFTSDCELASFISGALEMAVAPFALATGKNDGSGPRSARIASPAPGGSSAVVAFWAKSFAEDAGFSIAAKTRWPLKEVMQSQVQYGCRQRDDPISTRKNKPQYELTYWIQY